MLHILLTYTFQAVLERLNKYLKMILEMPGMQIPGTMEPRRHMAGLLQLPLNGDPWDLKGELSEDNNVIECHCWRWSLADNCMP